MTQTIEELAKQYTDELFAGDDLTDFDTQTEKNDAYVICMAFGNHLMEQPFASRLTPAEKERMRANYADAKDIHSRCVGTMSKNHIAELHNEYNKGLNMGIMIVLKHLFGKELFKEE